MNTTWTIKEKSTGTLRVVVDGETWQKAQNKAFNKLAQKVEVSGFRKGQVPKELARRHVSLQSILIEATQDFANEAYVEGLKAEQLEPVIQPTMDVEKLDEQEVIYTFSVTVKPEVTLGEYKGVHIEPIEVKVTAAQVNAELKKLQEEYAELVVREDEPAENGDTLIIDFEGFKDGEPFDGGKGENYSLELGSHSFIPGFEEQLIGAKANDEKELSLTFPENYQEASLAGQPVIFKVIVHEVKHKVLPELDDDFAKEVDREGIENLKDLKASIRKELKEAAKAQAEDDETQQLFDKVVADAKLDVPEPMIDEEIDNMYRELTQRLAQQGLNIDFYKQILGQSEEQIKEQMKEEAARRVQLRLVLEQVAKQENIEASEADVDAEYDEIAKQYGMEVDQVKALAPADAIAYDLKIRKAYDLVKASRV